MGASNAESEVKDLIENPDKLDFVLQCVIAEAFTEPPMLVFLLF